MSRNRRHAPKREGDLLSVIEEEVLAYGYNDASVSITVTFKDIDANGGNVTYELGDGTMFSEVVSESEPCTHNNQGVNDRSLAYCKDCGEELGR